MSIVSSCLVDYITIWSKDGLGADGNHTFKNQGQIRGRWRDSQELVTDANGREIHSTASVLSDIQLSIGDWVIKGRNNSASPPTEAREIQFSKQNRSLSGKDVHFKSFL